MFDRQRAVLACLTLTALRRPFDRIFTRIGTGDNIEANASSFMVEMQVGAREWWPRPCRAYLRGLWILGVTPAAAALLLCSNRCCTAPVHDFIPLLHCTMWLRRRRWPTSWTMPHQTALCWWMRWVWKGASGGHW